VSAWLTVRASPKADKDKPVPQKIEDAWTKYVTTLEQHPGRFPKEDANSTLGQAYWRFWEMRTKYKQ